MLIIRKYINTVTGRPDGSWDVRNSISDADNGVLVKRFNRPLARVRAFLFYVKNFNKYNR